MALPVCMRYDRTVTDEFLTHFLPQGFAGSLLEYAAARYPIDLQFRKAPSTGAQWATLYVGMTAVLNVEDKGTKGFRLKAHAKHAAPEFHWDESWTQPRPAAAWRAEWSKVENYLERIIPNATAGPLAATEGLVQAAVSVYRGGGERVTLDREVTPSYKDTATRSRVSSHYSNRLAEALRDSPVPGKPPTKFGSYCDVLAIRADGCLAAIEVKPGNVAGLSWVAAQATMYADVLQCWIDHDDEWEQIISRSFEQRQRLGLVPAGFELPKLQRKVVPAVAFQRIASEVYIERMFKVHAMLQDKGIGHPELQFFEVSLSGRLDERVPS